MGKFRAFLIGVADYKQPIKSLPFVPDDLAALSNALQSAGYEAKVFGERRPSLNEIRHEVSRFIRNAEPGDTTIVYLSGHGIHHQGNDYLVPGDVTADREFKPADHCVAISYWDEAIASSRGDNLVMFIDACREGISTGNTMSMGVTSWSRGRVKRYGRKKVAYVFACSAGERSSYVSSEAGSFSVFSRALKELAGDPAGPKSLDGLRNALRDRVLELTHTHKLPHQEVLLREGVTDIKPEEIVLFKGTGRVDAAPSSLPLPGPLPPPWWRRKLVLAAAVVTSILIGALGYYVSRPPSPVHLVFDSWGEPGVDMHGYNGLLEEYQRLNPHVTIEKRIARDLQEHQDNIQSRLRAETGLGDVVAAEEAIMGDMYVRPGDWVDLRPLVGDLSKSYVQYRWEGGHTPDGKRLLGLPTDVQSTAMCYRKDLFQQAGLPTERDAVGQLWPTWEAFTDVGVRYVTATSRPMLDNVRHAFSAMALQGGEPLFMDRNNVLAVSSSTGLRTAWTRASTMLDKNISARKPAFTKDWQDGFARDTFATTLCPNWMLSVIESNAGPALRGQWDVAALPGGGAHWGGSWLSVPVQSKHQAEAAKLIVFLTSKQGQLTAFARQPGVFPSHLEAIASSAVQDHSNAYFNNAPIGKIYSTAAIATKPIYLGCRYTTIREKAFVNALGEVENAGLQPEKGWERALSDADRFRC